MSQVVPFSLTALRSHSIFVPPSSCGPSSPGSASSSEEWEVLDKPAVDPLVGQKNTRMITRDKDVIVAVGKEVRMMTIGNGENWKVEDGYVGSYKSLKSAHLTFTIHHLVLSSTGRLLAVVGHHQVVVLVLPKATYSSATAGPIDVQSIPIDEFTFSPSSTETVSKALWHPWGESGNSLWILSANGKLREYDILQPHDSIQTFDFLPGSQPRSTSRFTAVDPLSRIATSFTFSPLSPTFGPLMVYCLIANGDIYTIGPVLPLRTEMPTRYLQQLKAYADARLAMAQGQARDVFGAGQAGLGRATFQVQWVDSLVKQVKQAEEARARREQIDEEGTPQRRRSMLGKSKLGNSPARASSPREATPREGTVRVHPPHLTESGGPAPGTHRPLLRQGPVVFSPGPQEVANGDEDLDEDQAATDLLLEVVEVEQEGEDEKAKGKIRETMVMIAWSGGRVDIGLEEEKPEPRWISTRDTLPSPIVIPIVESILLPFPRSDPSSIACNAPSFSRDSLYSDAIYVQHSFGVDSITVGGIVKAMHSDNDDELPESEVQRLVESAGSKSAPIVGLINFCNIVLGYGLVALASTYQVAYVELDMRLDPTSTPSPTNPTFKPTSSSDRDSQSLLLKPLEINQVIWSIREPKDFNPKAVLQKRVPGYTKPTATITSEHLAALGEVFNQFQKRIQSVCSASQTVEARLDLQVKELQRQVTTLMDSRKTVQTLQESGEGTLARVEALIEKQEKIGKRLEGVLGNMALEYRPEIGEVEKRWFEELERLRVRVRGGVGIGKEKVLANRVQVLKEQIAALQPLLAELKSSTADAPASPAYGSKQLKPMEAAVSARSEEIRRLIKKLEVLDMRVDAARGVEQE
ncbi:hypothetical protein IAT38_006529 [Cryptococcus sp. DSM 104549]